MYGYEWTKKPGIYRLVPNAKVIKEIRPVFWEELDYFGFDAYWQYPRTEAPLLWAEGVRRYVLNGEVVAEATGGGFYTKPKVSFLRKDVSLEAVSMPDLWQENESLMRGLEDAAIAFIRQVHDDYTKKGMHFVVAFSGGKDSLVLLDLVAKALRPDEFVVIFSNTGMELQATLDSVRRAQQHWPNVHFHEAISHMTPDESWDAFGPPGRRMRWCCAVHKSVPTMLKLRAITGDYNATAVVFDGIRKEESATRALYEAVGEGVKNINQINCSPILEWGSAEVYMYLLHYNIQFNSAYRQGLFRVGCKVCPMTSAWWDGIANDIYAEEMRSLLEIVEEYARNTKEVKEQKKYIETGGRKARMGGRGLHNGGSRITEIIDEDSLMFQFSVQTGEWLAVCKILGEIVEHSGNAYTQFIDKRSFTFTVEENRVTYSSYAAMDRFIISRLRSVAHKVAFCVGCMACVVECPTGAFAITETNRILIREDLCTHCGNCLRFMTIKGCMVAKSLTITGGNRMNINGINRYQCFGFRKVWLDHFNEFGVDCFDQGRLGNRQYTALKVWLREAGFLTAAGIGKKAGTETELYARLKLLGADHPLAWAIIWANLAYTSVICRWYMLHAQVGETYSKDDLVFMLGDDLSFSNRVNAIRALSETLRHSPIGAALKQGIPLPDGSSFKFVRQGWEAPEAVAIIYALYKFAEETGRYTFTLSQLERARGSAEAVGVDPVAIYGLNPNGFKALVQDIALHFPDLVRVAFVQDLDNVMLVPGKKAFDVLDFFVE